MHALANSTREEEAAAERPAMSGAGGGFLADANDPWLKPRLLRAVVGERLPRPGTDLPPAELASILDAVRTHGLLTERQPGPHDPKLAEAWRAAVDAWVERIGELMQSNLVCWPLVRLAPYTVILV